MVAISPHSFRSRRPTSRSGVGLFVKLALALLSLFVLLHIYITKVTLNECNENHNESSLVFEDHAATVSSSNSKLQKIHEQLVNDPNRRKVDLPSAIQSAIACSTQQTPDPLTYFYEMYQASVLEENLRSQNAYQKGYTFKCGSNPNFKVPPPPTGMLINYYQAASVWCALELESIRLNRPANFLVWGLGNDSEFWKQATKGRVVFIEDNKQWFDMVKRDHPGLNQYLTSYSTVIDRDLALFQKGDIESINDLIRKNNQLLDPLHLQTEQWDVILVDAPNGCHSTNPGRFGPMFTSKKIVDEQGHGLIFVDDYQRDSERVLSDTILEGKGIGNKLISNSRHGGHRGGFGNKVAEWDRIHPSSKLYIEKFAMFSFGESDTEQMKMSIRNLDSQHSQEQQKEANVAQILSAGANDDVTVDQCRNVFKTQGQGGYGSLSPKQIKTMCASKGMYNSCEDLKEFTGLSDLEFNTRMQREGRFHFEGEHMFWNPQSRSELAWYYATSVDYLFANSVHVSNNLLEVFKEPSQGPVLDYSGGVGNNIIELAKAGIPCQYFGIGMMEYTFAEYRVRKYQLEHLVSFIRPWNSKTNWSFDPINGPLPRDGSLGGIVAIDVLEHIPDYQNVVKAMVESLRVGGIIVENTPFGSTVENGEEDLRVHVSDGGITMSEAMGESMKNIGKGKWQKVQK